MPAASRGDCWTLARKEGPREDEAPPLAAAETAFPPLPLLSEGFETREEEAVPRVAGGFVEREDASLGFGGALGGMEDGTY
ncbi:hypothetical protein FRB91_005605 [Serendipita sp. 411]|nr:hypothetical protein FRB91_005605 [Serendipita sp. 411]